MARPSKLILGLGNPGPAYATTRHNAGFLAADRVAEQVGGAGGPLRFQDLGFALVAEGSWRGRAFALAKPTTWMNRSGQAYRALLRRYGFTPEEALVVYDDIALPPGAIRLREKGSAGGHNGMQDIVDHLGSEDFPRLRIGIGSDFPRGRQADYVLEPFTDEELRVMDEALGVAADAALTFVRDGLTTAMNRFNRKGPAPA
ncbi:MAG TPA: aminoacyl-tRNA hydrolase [Rubricoccaceae bacterium]|nr:aminoacyl-tRNA hydrolase [Rubricoccaceae bacterium]